MLGRNFLPSWNFRHANLLFICDFKRIRLYNTHMNHLLLWISFIYGTSHAHYKKKYYTISIEIILPVCKSVHKNTVKQAFDHCQITDPDPEHIGFHSGFSSDYINSFSVGQISSSQIAVGGLHPNFMGVGKPKKITKGHFSVWLQWSRNDALNKRKTSCAHTFIRYCVENDLEQREVIF